MSDDKLPMIALAIVILAWIFGSSDWPRSVWPH